MNKIINIYDANYLDIVSNIIENKEFNCISSIEHHGISRYDHSLKVSYYSYKVAKTLKLNYTEAARGGLLHDFFLSPDDRSKKDRFMSLFSHSKIAVKNASEKFDINEKEIDIIKTHMFPVNLYLPKYAESWVVNLVDKCVSIFEFSNKFKYKFKYATNLYLIFLFNLLR